MIYQLTVVSRG